MSEWIKCSERLPDENVHVLISNSEGIEVACLIPAAEDGPDSMGHDAGWCGMVSFPGRSFGNPSYFYEAQGQATHWMPLPLPPEDSQ